MTAKLETVVSADEDVAFARATVSIIAKTRRHWAMRQDRFLAPNTTISVGIGYAALTRDGETVYEEDCTGERAPMTVEEAEKLARREANHDWRIHLVAQLEDRHYRRVGAGRWIIYERGYGMS
jgi:ribonuclease HII